MVGRASRVAATLFLLAAPGVVSAVEPVAIVQSVEASGTSVRAMELIERGRVFELGAKGRLVLGYFRSCLHEEITGGRVTVGVRESRVEGGRVARRRVECDGRIDPSGGATLWLDTSWCSYGRMLLCVGTYCALPTRLLANLLARHS